MLTVVKFIANTNKESDNKIISRTMGKIGVFSSRDGSLSPQQIPEPGEFWRVEIVKEVINYLDDGSTGGCFVLKPMSKVGYSKEGNPDIDYLIPGGYQTIRYKTALVIIPKTLGFNWITEKDLRHHLRDQHHGEEGYGINSFVVSLDGSDNWPVEEIGKGAPETPNLNIYSSRR